MPSPSQTTLDHPLSVHGQCKIPSNHQGSLSRRMFLNSEFCRLQQFFPQQGSGSECSYYGSTQLYHRSDPGKKRCPILDAICLKNM